MSWQTGRLQLRLLFPAERLEEVYALPARIVVVRRLLEYKIHQSHVHALPPTVHLHLTPSQFGGGDL